jgi:hypothetical protein
MAVRLTSNEAFLRVLDRAASVELVASLLPHARHGVIPALERAAERGACVEVRLEAEPYDPGGRRGAARANRAMVAELRAHGVDARTVSSAPDAPLHIKAAIVDGRLFLDDRNWVLAGGDTIVATNDAADIAAVRAAMHGHAPHTDVGVAVRKGEALALEADIILRSPPKAEIAVESESFGVGVIASALLRRARDGERVRLLVSARDMRGTRERDAAARLVAAGVCVRTESGVLNEKLCVAGDRAWIGSANATNGLPNTIDWGMRTRAKSVVRELRGTFEKNWCRAKPFTEKTTKTALTRERI